MVFTQAFDLLIAVAGQADLDFVFAVLGEGVGNQGTASRSKREAFDMLVLGEVGVDADRVAAWERSGQCRRRGG